MDPVKVHILVDDAISGVEARVHDSRNVHSILVGIVSVLTSIDGVPNSLEYFKD